MNVTEKIYSCSRCDYKSGRKYNVARHTVTKHSQNELKTLMPNVITPVPNVITNAPNGISNATTESGKECLKCHRTFSARKKMLKHAEKCNGVANKLQCDYCNVIFTQRSNKSRHIRTCKVKLMKDSLALTVIPDIQDIPVIPVIPVIPESSQSQHPIQSIDQSITNSVVGDSNMVNSQNTTTTNVTNVIVFQPNTMFAFDHISKKKCVTLCTA